MKKLIIFSLLMFVFVFAACTDTAEENVKLIEKQHSIDKEDHTIKDGDTGQEPDNSEG